MINWNNIKEQLQNFLKEELSKTNLENVIVGVSGGLDSAIVAILCKETFYEKMSAVLMPSQFSSEQSIEHAIELCDKFKIKYEIKSIASMVEAYIENMDEDKLRIGNFSARMRMSVLYDMSSRDKSIVVGTSNKSELLLGYGTIFGDIACAINPLGEIYKSDEYAFGGFLGVPKSILEKKPSADLWRGQSDEEELGYSYKSLDKVLKLLVEEKKTTEDLINQGFDEEMINTIKHKMKINEFKGKLPVIAKIEWS